MQQRQLEARKDEGGGVEVQIFWGWYPTQTLNPEWEWGAEVWKIS